MEVRVSRQRLHVKMFVPRFSRQLKRVCRVPIPFCSGIQINFAWLTWCQQLRNSDEGYFVSYPHVSLVCVLDDISSLTWHPSSHFFASAGGADKHIRVWHNTAGIKAQIRDLEEQLKKAKTDSLKVRTKARIECMFEGFSTYT